MAKVTPKEGDGEMQESYAGVARSPSQLHPMGPKECEHCAVGLMGPQFKSELTYIYIYIYT